MLLWQALLSSHIGPSTAVANRSPWNCGVTVILCLPYRSSYLEIVGNQLVSTITYQVTGSIGPDKQKSSLEKKSAEYA